MGVLKIIFIFYVVAIFRSTLCDRLVINTWGFQQANEAAFQILQSGGSGLDAVVAGCGECEKLQCDGTVGFGGSPDEYGDTRLDALLVDGTTMNVGAVASMRSIRNAIGVARCVLENTRHSLLVGDRATDFAIAMGFPREDTETEHSKQLWANWKDNSCQPNFWINVAPNPKESCGPYQPVSANEVSSKVDWIAENSGFGGPNNHDTIGMVAIDGQGNVVAGTSTNGATHKIAGRVGDSPIPGSGAYADSEVGGAAATGDGDILMRFLPSFLAVEQMRRGSTPKAAAEIAIRRIIKFYPDFTGGIVVTDKNGRYAAACHGMERFPFVVATDSTNGSQKIDVECL